jgi:hypothetical protein
MKYQITVRGALDESWSNWLGHVEVIFSNVDGSPATTLHVDVPDQPALLGLLNRLANMNLVLISVQQGAETHGK